MSDVHTTAVRSKNMASIRSRNTRPEFIVRRALHAIGYRYSLHASHLPGTPDLVFTKYRAVLFVNGCFWHGHDCYLFKWPSTRKEFWEKKILGNVERDIRNIDLLGRDWRIGVVWECALKGKTRVPVASLVASITNWLEEGSNRLEIPGAD